MASSVKTSLRDEVGSWLGVQDAMSQSRIRKVVSARITAAATSHSSFFRRRDLVEAGDAVTLAPCLVEAGRTGAFGVHAA